MVPYRIGTHCRQQPHRFPVVEYDVLIEGVAYRCDDVQFDLLCKGVPLDELELIRLEDDDD